MNLAQLQQQPQPQMMPQGQMMHQSQPQEPPQEQVQDQNQGPPPSLQGAQGESEARQYMTAILQNPTPNIVHQVVSELMKTGNPNAEQVAQHLMQIVNNPKMLVEVATKIMQSLN